MKALCICVFLCGTAFAQQKSSECPRGQHVEGECDRGCACVSDAETAAAQVKAGVFVEPWKTLVRDTVTVNAGQALQYNFTLEAGTKLTALFHVEGGIDDRVQVLLLDSANYQLYTAHRPFAKTPSTSALIQGIGKRNFQVTHDDIYYLLLDNGRAWLLPV